MAENNVVYEEQSTIDDIISETISYDEEHIETENIEIEELDIKSICPFDINIRKVNDSKIATLILLGTTNNDDIVLLYRLYLMNNPEDEDFVTSIPFYSNINEQFVSRKIIYDMAINKYTRINIKMEFESSFDSDIIKCKGIYNESKNDVILNMNRESYMSMKFVDDYIMSGITNEHDLAMVSVVGARSNINTSLFIVNDIDILDMAPANIIEIKKFLRKPKYICSTTLAIALKLTKKTDLDDKEVVTLLTPMDVGKEYPIEKFKSCVVDKIQEKYFEESYNYVQTLMTTDNIIDNEKYMIIRGKSADGDITYFAISKDLEDKLIKLIEEY